jgi:hypothetical protein
MIMSADPLPGRRKALMIKEVGGTSGRRCWVGRGAHAVADEEPGVRRLVVGGVLPGDRGRYIGSCISVKMRVVVTVVVV